MNYFKELSYKEQQETDGGKISAALSPSLGGFKLAIKYLLSFSDDFKKGVAAGIDDARRDYNNGIIR